MKQCEICKKEEAIVKIQWIKKDAIKFRWLACGKCFIKLAKNYEYAQSK